MRKFLKTMAFTLLGLVLSVNLNAAIADGTYVLCTSTNDLEADAHYIIASGTDDAVKCISNVSNSNNRKVVEATVSDSKISVESTSTIMTFTLGGSADAWTFSTDNYAGTAGYLASAASGKNNYLRVIADTTTATISFSKGAAVITLQPHTERNILMYNSGSTLFACYSSGQSPVYLYKKASSTPTPTYDTLYLNTGGSNLWNQGSAKFAAWHWSESVEGKFSDYLAPIEENADIYRVVLPQGMEKVVFVRMKSDAPATPEWGENNANVWNQTSDLEVPTNGNNCYTITGWGEEKSEGSWSKYVPAVPTFYITGNADLVGKDKEWAADAIEMEDGSYTFKNLAAGDYEMKVTKGDWNKTSYGFEALSKESSKYIYDASGNIRFILDEEGDVTVTIANEQVTVTGTFAPITTTFSVEVPEKTPNCFIAGSFNEWAFQPMNKVDETHYILMLEGELEKAEYKYTCGKDWKYVEVIDANRTYSKSDEVSEWTRVPGDTYSDIYTNNIALPEVNANAKISEAKVVCYGDTFPARKVGSGSGDRICKLVVPAGTKTLHLHAAGWNGKSVKISVTGVTSPELTVISDAVISGTATTFALKEDPESFYLSIPVNSAEEKEITLTGTERFVLFGVNAEGGYVAPEYYIAGNMTDWAKEMVLLETVGKDSLSAKINLKADSLYQFKVVKVQDKDTTWFGMSEAATMELGNSMGWWLYKSIDDANQANVGLQTTKDSTYVFYVNMEVKDHVGEPVVSVVIPNKPVISYADTAYYVAGNFTNWTKGMLALPAEVEFPKDSVLEFKQIMLRTILSDGDSIGQDTTWYGQPNEGNYMTRDNSTWKLDGDNNVFAKTDLEGKYTFSLNKKGEFVITWPKEPVKYYAKNNWNGAAAQDWSWLEMSATDQENVYMLDSVVFGGTGVNINDKADDTDALYFAADKIVVLNGLDGIPVPYIPEPRKHDTILYAPRHSGVVLEAPQLQAGDTIKLFFYAADSTLKAAVLGRPTPPEPAKTFDLTVIQDTVWTADGSKVAAWVWSKEVKGEWTDWATNNNDTLTLKVNEKADSIIFVRNASNATEPTWEVLNRIDVGKINDCRTFYIINWNEGAWCERPLQPIEGKYYVTGNAALVGEDKEWNAQAIEMTDSTYTFKALAAGEYEMKITNGAWDPVGLSWGSADLSEECSAGVGDFGGNIYFVVETPNDVVVSIAKGVVTVKGIFKQPEPIVTFDLTVIQDTVWTADGSKVAAWVWSKEVKGEWTDWATNNNDTLTLKVNEKADSIIFVRNASNATEPTWEVLNRIDVGKINDCRTYYITNWEEGAWCERPEKPIETKYYVTGNDALVGSAKAWDAQAIEMNGTTYTFTALAVGEYKLKVTNGSWGKSWGYSDLSETLSVEGLSTDDDNNICFTVYTPNDVTITLSEGHILTISGNFKQEHVIEPSITGVIISGDKYVGTELTFTAQVAGFSAEPVVIYEVKAEGGEYAQAQGGKFTPAAAGNYTVKATAFYQPEEGNAEEATKEQVFTVTQAPAVKYYVTGNAALVGKDKEWNAQAIEMSGNTYTFTALAVGEYKLKVTNGSWGKSWGYSDLSETLSVEGLSTDEDNNICFTVYTPNDVTITISEGHILTISGNFKPEPVETKYYIKNNWSNGQDWTWVEMQQSNDSFEWEYTGVIGTLGVNISTSKEDQAPAYYSVEEGSLVQQAGSPEIGTLDTVTFYFDSSEDDVVVYKVIGKYQDPTPVTPDFGLLVNGTNYLAGTPEDKGDLVEYVVNTTLAIGDFVQLYNNVKQEAWTVTPEGNGFTDFEMKNDAYYIKQAGNYQFYIKIPKEGMNSGLYVGFTGAGTGLDKLKRQAGQRYNIMGQRVSKDYHGMVIMNGQTFLQK